MSKFCIGDIVRVKIPARSVFQYPAQRNDDGSIQVKIGCNFFTLNKTYKIVYVFNDYYDLDNCGRIHERFLEAVNGETKFSVSKITREEFNSIIQG